MKLTLLLASLSVSAFALDPHVEAVIRAVEGAKGKVEKTEDGLSLKLVDLAVPGAGPHNHRTVDPYDAAFFEHLGHISTLESLNVISTKFNDEWMPHIAKLTHLKTLRFTNNGKLTDADLSQEGSPYGSVRSVQVAGVDVDRRHRRRWHHACAGKAVHDNCLDTAFHYDLL